MKERVCKNCGGREYKVVGQNMVRCKFCGTLYVDEENSKEEEVLLVQAKTLARECDFEAAIESYDSILTDFPMSAEAFFGKSLAKHKVVLYNVKNSTNRRPRFFGDKVESISDDEDFKAALQFAPPEQAKVFNQVANRIDRIKKVVENTKLQNDIVLCTVGKENLSGSAKAAIESLKQNFAVYDLDDIQTNEQERESFPALVSCKVFLLFDCGGDNFADYKHLFDRYSYFIKLRKKARASFAVCTTSSKETCLAQLPKYLSFAISVLEISQPSFQQELSDFVNKMMAENVEIKQAKIEKIDIQQAKPQKKEYVDVENVTPVELGNYEVENVELSDQSKLKWIFLSLKNGDFETAKNDILTELEKDPYSADLLFAKLLADRKIKTKEDFFASIGNFRDKEAIDKILGVANKAFAEDFVDRWENLVISLDQVEYYNAFLLYLAKYSTPNRENFVAKAEEKAVETQNEQLIDAVLKCFDQKDVQRYVEFYNMLAQKTDDEKYFKKILEIDPGHQQSNIALLLSHFKTTKDKLTYQNKEEIESTFKFLSEKARAQFVDAVIEMLLPVSFCDIDQAQKQLEFYLSYVSDEQIVPLLAKTSEKFKQMGFFTAAEKYVAIAISKEAKASLFWQLIMVKAHCKSDNELVTCSVKVAQLPEWNSILQLSSDQENEKYAEIVSKNNMYKGERKPLAPETLDKVALSEKLSKFLMRNQKILLECEKEKTDLYRGVGYFKAQLQPFEMYLKKLESVEDFDAFLGLQSKIQRRLECLDLTLDTSINVAHMQNKDDGLKYIQPQKTQEEIEKSIKKLKNDKFLKSFLIIFLEIFPLAFSALLFLISVFLPKEVYLFFSRNFLIASLIVCVILGFANFVFYYCKKKRLEKKLKFVTLFVSFLAATNLLLFCTSFYFVTNQIEINSVREMQTLLANAPHANFVLTQDLDFENADFFVKNFSGKLDGKNHKVENAAYLEGTLFESNLGEVKNLTIVISQQNLKVSSFGGIAIANLGTISNCKIEGGVQIESDSVVAGGLVAANNGKIQNCVSSLDIAVSAKKATVGAVVGQVAAGKQETLIFQNKADGKIAVSTTEKATVGGIAGKLQSLKDFDLSQNVSQAEIVLSGQGQADVGGLFGFGENESQNNRSAGSITLTEFVGTANVGGLYGTYKNSVQERVKTSVSTTTFVGSESFSFGALVGHLSGGIERCFGTGSSRVVATNAEGNFQSLIEKCSAGEAEIYKSSYNFSAEIWSLQNLPVLLFESQI